MILSSRNYFRHVSVALTEICKYVIMHRMSKQANLKKWIVYVSTFPPRECGIATFTEDLMNSFDEMYKPREEAKVVAMNLDQTSRYAYDKSRVIYQIPQPSDHHYEEAAKYLNSLAQVVLVHVQHEFGIFGGAYGGKLINFLRELKKPAVITFHTVLPTPNPELKDMVSAINNHVQKIIVMTETSRRILIEEYGIDPEKIAVIAHGIHPVNFSDGQKNRAELGLSDAAVISTFGLIGRGKGIEYGIEAMAEIVKKNPNAVYLIIGATHPVVLKNEGEIYRNSLVQKVRDLNLEDHVFFYDKYLELRELLYFLEATHIYLALSQDPNQAVSGTLSYALGSGRPVISTSFAQAKEDVTEDVGILVDFKDVKGIADAASALLNNPKNRELMGKNAYFKTRARTWRNSVLRHMNEYIRIVPLLGEEEKNLPRIRLTHLGAMTDSFGIIQFANLITPDQSSGYTLDDNARALVATVKYYEISGKKKIFSLIHAYLNFIASVQAAGGGFHNYVDAQRKTISNDRVVENLESASARAMYALAITAASLSLPQQFRDQAAELFRKHLPMLFGVTSPRSIAYAIKALRSWDSAYPSAETVQAAAKLADRLVEYYEKTSAADWHWFEDILAYANGVMPNSLVDAYELTKNEKYLSIARESLDFLIANSFKENVCIPIGQNGWLKRGKKKYNYDQQPEEAASLVLALKAIYAVTGDKKYARRMRDAFDWFLGNNLLHCVVYDQNSGGCFDGVGEKEVNLNQGAESTIMYLLARLEFEQSPLEQEGYDIKK
jgi:glycosyltransferase involved in cell wall biosynthesis